MLHVSAIFRITIQNAKCQMCYPIHRSTHASVVPLLIIRVLCTHRGRLRSHFTDANRMRLYAKCHSHRRLSARLKDHIHMDSQKARFRAIQCEDKPSGHLNLTASICAHTHQFYHIQFNIY